MADGDGDSTNDPTITLTDPNPDMEVIKTAFVNDNGDGLTGAGDIVRYSIEVTNTGDITLDNVYIQTENLTDGNGTLLTLSSGPDYWQPQTIESWRNSCIYCLICHQPRSSKLRIYQQYSNSRW